MYTNPSYLAVSKLAVFSNSRFSFCYFPPNSRSQTLKFAVLDLSDSLNQAQTKLDVVQILNLVMTYCGDSL